MRTWLLVIIMALTQQAAHAQARNYNVLFGAGNWLNLYNEVATVIPCSWSITHRSASISETDGALSMVVDETGIHNAAFDLVQGGSAQDLGWPAELSSILILPKPGAVQHYIVFINTTEAIKQAGWVEVDMSFGMGAGQVIGAGTAWYMGGCTAKLAATPHPNGTDYWVLQHADGSDAFHAYRLSAAGLDPVPVISNAGPVLGPTGINEPYRSDYHASMKFSVGGEQLVMGYNAVPDTGAAALFRFNAATGQLILRTAALRSRSRYIQPFTGDTIIIQNRNPLVGGMDFLNTDDYVYVVYLDTMHTDSSGDSYPVQYDLTLADEEINEAPCAIVGVAVGIDVSWVEDTLGESLMLAADGHLYLRWPLKYYGALSRYDSLPASLQDPGGHFTQIPMTPNLSTWGLPLFCKRYHDSEPAWLGIGGPELQRPAFRAVPNPIAERGALVWGHSPPPDHLVWRDAMGRTLRTETARNDGPTTVLLRQDLPPGPYLIEVGRQGKILGTAKVLLE